MILMDNDDDDDDDDGGGMQLYIYHVIIFIALLDQLFSWDLVR